MAKSKEQKKKGKKSKKVDREWERDGGVTFDSEEAQFGTKKRIRRETQAKDDRNVRMAQRKQLWDKEAAVKRKLSEKVSFGAVVREAEAEIEDGEESDGTNDEDQKPWLHHRPSERSVLDRLRGHLKKGVGVDEEGSDEDEDEDDGEEEQEVKQEEEEHDSDNNEEDTEEEEGEEEQGEEVEDEEDDQSQDGEGDRGHDDEEELSSGTVYEWFFNQSPMPVDSSSSVSAAVATGKGQKKGKSSATLDENGLRTFTNKHTWETPLCCTGKIDAHLSLPSTPRTWGDYPGLHKLWRSRADTKFSKIEGIFLPYLISYGDMLLERRSDEYDSKVLSGIVAHVGAHVMKARTRQQRHDSRMKKKKARAIAKSKLRAVKRATAVAKANNDYDGDGVDANDGDSVSSVPSDSDEDGGGTAASDSPNALQDQGFTRPRILILCPFRGSCFTIIEALINFFGENTSISKLDQFAEEYGYDGSDDEGDACGKKRRRTANQPTDWKALFKQNVDDDFKMGIQVNPGKGKGNGADKGVQLRLFSDFYMSDVIIASPMGLRLLAEGKRVKNFDFLSSLEVLMLYQADVMSMQNWEHVDFVMRHCNQQPVEDHGTDFSRVRPYFLNGDSASHRQLLLTTHFNSPEIQALFRRHSQSRAGSFRLRSAQYEGMLDSVTSRVQQVFQRIPCDSFAEEHATRFSYFTKSILSQVIRLEQTRTLIVAPSYLDYVKVRNELIRLDSHAAFICEYSRDSEISRGRSRFFHGHEDLLLYSGRAHFFRRLRIRGALHIIFYSLPQYEHFYPELVNLLGDEDELGKSTSISCTVLFTKYESMALERIVGTKRAQHMHASKKNTFMFC